jgi:argininosuccinate lyase
MKLWKKKGIELDKEVEEYTVGNDYILDNELLPYDIKASKAHAKMLQACGYLTKEELEKLLAYLDEVEKLHSQGKFTVKQEDEDSHTAIENYLVQKLGDVGKKIHTARSRNDQSMTMVRLFMLDKLNEVKKRTEQLQSALKSFAQKNKWVQMPGYTHMRKAMPTTVDTLAMAYHDMLSDDLQLLDTVLKTIDTNPLGSAAGHGVPLRIDRQMTTKELGFAKVQENPIHCANTRGKYESLVIHVAFCIMQSLNKMATDLALFTMEEFGFFILPDDMCTGSSIMPQKQNPDVLELVRGNAHVVHGCLVTVNGILLNLPTGYNRDFQLTKEPMTKSLKITDDSLKIMAKVFSRLKTQNTRLKTSMTPELYATEKAYELVAQGMQFRDAYQKVAEELSTT